MRRRTFSFSWKALGSTCFQANGFNPRTRILSVSPESKAVGEL